MCNCLLQSVLLVCTLLELVESRQCGFPGRPRNGTSATGSVMSRPGDTARYTCQPGFTLFGDEERVCLDSGIWAGRQPICALNLARGHSAMLSATLWNYRAALAVDGKLDTCSYAPRTSEPRWWQVDLTQDHHVASVGVFISKDIYQEFTVFVVQLVSRQARYKPCAIFKGRFQNMKIFQCNEGLGLTGRYIYIRDDRRDLNDYFGLCEVEVFTYSERVVCGEPEEPVSGHVSWSPDGPAMYTCEPGLELTAEPNRTCEADGRWAGHAPQCKAIECNPPPGISFGSLRMHSHVRGPPFLYGYIVKYYCRPGYVILGNATRSCTFHGKWSGHEPLCKSISCSYPPVFPHTEVELVNKSTLWNTIAIYSCKSGYSSSEGSLQAMSSCLSTGMWEEVNISCELDASLHRLGPLQGTGWSHRSQDTDKQLHEGPLGILGIIIISALCILLLVVIVGVIIILTRRFKSQTNAQAAKSAATNELILNNKKDDTYDDVASPGYPVVVTTDTSKTSDNTLENTVCPAVTNHHNLFPQPGEHSSYNTLNSFPSVSSYNSTLATDTDEEQNYARVKARKNCEPGYESVKVQVERVAMYPDYETVHAGLQQFDSSYEPIHSTCLQERQNRQPNHISSRSIHLLPSALKVFTQPNNNKMIQQPDIGDCTGRVPQEILALYAQVDKTKKVRYRLDPNDPEEMDDVTEFSGPVLHEQMMGMIEESNAINLASIQAPYEPYNIPPVQFSSPLPERSVSPNSGRPLPSVPGLARIDEASMSHNTPVA